MNVTIQEVTLKGFAVLASEDSSKRRLTLDGDRGEKIFVTCAMADFMQLAAALLKGALTFLLRKAATDPSNEIALRRGVKHTEEHVAVRVEVVAESSAHVLVINTIDEKQLRILLMPAQRDAVLNGLAPQDPRGHGAAAIRTALVPLSGALE